MKEKITCFSLKRIASLFLMTIVFLAGCKKTGTLMPNEKVIRATIQVSSIKTDSKFKVIVSNVVLIDSLPNENNVTRNILRSEDPQRLKIENIISSETIIDTMIVFPSPFANYNIIQLDTTEGAKPLFIDQLAGSDDTIPDQHLKLSIYVKDELLPETIDISIYKVTPRVKIDTPAIYELKGVQNNGSFTDFLLLDWSEYYYICEIRDSKTGELVRNYPTINFARVRGGIRINYCESNKSNHQIIRFSNSYDAGFDQVLYGFTCLYQY